MEKNKKKKIIICSIIFIGVALFVGINEYIAKKNAKESLKATMNMIQQKDTRFEIMNDDLNLLKEYFLDNDYIDRTNKTKIINSINELIEEINLDEENNVKKEIMNLFRSFEETNFKANIYDLNEINDILSYMIESLTITHKLELDDLESISEYGDKVLSNCLVS